MSRWRPFRERGLIEPSARNPILQTIFALVFVAFGIFGATVLFWACFKDSPPTGKPTPTTHTATQSPEAAPSTTATISAPVRATVTATSTVSSAARTATALLGATRVRWVTNTPAAPTETPEPRAPPEVLPKTGGGR